MPSDPPPSYEMPRNRPPPFRPRAFLVVLYWVFVFAVVAMLLILPEMMEILGSVPPGPEQQVAAEQAAHEAAKPMLPIAFSIATVFTGLGAYFKVLPGLR